MLRSTASGDEKNTVNFPNNAERLEKKQIHDDVYTDLFKRPSSSSSSAEGGLRPPGGKTKLIGSKSRDNDFDGYAAS